MSANLICSLPGLTKSHLLLIKQFSYCASSFKLISVRCFNKHATAAAEVNTNTWLRSRDITEHDRRLLQKQLILYQSRSARRKQKLAVLEGIQLISAAVNTGLCIKNIYFTQQHISDKVLANILSDTGVKFHLIHGDLIRQTSQIGLASSVFGLCSIPESDIPSTSQNKSRLPICMICDNIRDPGNMAVLVTLAVATSCDQLILTKGCVDVWDPKVLKLAGPAMFKIKMRTELDWTQVESAAVSNGNFRVLLADCGSKQSQSLPLYDYDRLSYQQSDNIILVIGGETHGLSSAAHQFCASHNGYRIRIPMLPHVDSLNSAVAASILLFEIRKQMLKDH